MDAASKVNDCILYTSIVNRIEAVEKKMGVIQIQNDSHDIFTSLTIYDL